MITPEQARELILAHVKALPAVMHPATEALAFYLAEPILADRDVPPADRSAMDGYAVRAGDVAKTPVVLPVGAEVAAGSPCGNPVPAGACVRIFTGGNIPVGADAVVIQENTEPEGEKAVRILKPVAVGENVFKQGENAQHGETLLERGVRLDASALALCAAVGRASLRVHRRPVAGVLATGSELLDAGEGALAHQIRDSNSPFLRAALAEHHLDVLRCERASDSADRIVASLRTLVRQTDVVILTGGVSVGRYDFTAEAVKSAGGVILFHGVAIKPGKPLLFAVTPEGQLIFGLPGNPLSAMVGFHEFVLPALRLLSGCPQGRCWPCLTVRIGKDISLKGDRQTYLPARLNWTPTGPEAVEVHVKGSSDLVAGSKAEGTLVVPANVKHLAAGSYLSFRPWRGFA
ncbi:MAG: gephyrin-like molybdotransferase Glp [bacterium]